ncbi:uncharacterized protein ACA1_166770 [Acanthamoeba castellanii str. Neff]|uniref:Uncharacterized protein n=1 Tax=Acanthamoeba castellanii (strain ATCC 30010 / Neff) TaxID=1257118 RepID=L8H0R2_ACACF|nr:uncharacterized protein ACA1_166770 [Acanthamoeba castellanii str. Neff]ELR18830.1 hypothetical protein ACA1_166770 [Acanthamoeba castellanii str. Neff]
MVGLCHFLLLLVALASCLAAVVASAAGGDAGGPRWHELLESAIAVDTSDETVVKAALYAVDRVSEAYAKVMGSPHYIARVAAEPYFVLESIQRAFLRKPGGKYCLELVLNNPVATSNLGAVQYLTDRLRATPELGALFTRWRTERRQEETRLNNEGKDEPYSPLQPLTRRDSANADMLPRHLRAFFMGLDPIQDANQPVLLGATPEVHRVVVSIDPLDGEFEVQFHQRVSHTHERQQDDAGDKTVELLL